jgi:translation initiation factor IF-3
MAFQRRSKEEKVLVNDQIKAPNMLVLDADGEKIGMMPRRTALYKAQEQEMDLIQMHYDFNEKIATVKLVDLWKYLYEQQKVAKEQKKNKKKPLKQIKFGYGIGDNDLQFKIANAQKFLEEGHPVKIAVRLRGREKIYSERVYEKLLTIQEYLQDRWKPQYPKPKEEAHWYSITLSPKS